MSLYEQDGQHFYSESLDVLIMSLGAKGDLGYVFHVIYSGNEAYKNPLMEATETFIDENFVPCDFDHETNQISFLGEDEDAGETT